MKTVPSGRYSKSMASDETRRLLMEAAKRVMQRSGAGNLTLDAVAKEAGVSKGGLLYHFPSKSDLLRGMIAAGGNHMRQSIEAQMEALPGRRSFARAFLRCSVFGPPDKSCKPSSEAIWSMLGATANDPGLLTPIREAHEEMRQRLLAEGLDPDMANLLRLVGHGLWMTEIFGFTPPTDDERRRLYDLIARLAQLQADDSSEDTRERLEKENRG